MAKLGFLKASSRWIRKPAPGKGPQLHARWLTSRRDILRAQRLRCRTFSEEFGIRISPFGLDRDRFDRHCLHLGVEDRNTGALIGYTRLLPGEAARRLGGFYSRSEFDLDKLSGLPGHVVEVGRTCVHPDYRSGGTIAVLWAALAQYLFTARVDYLIGCASISMADGGAGVASIMPGLRERYLTDEYLRVTPRLPVPAVARCEAAAPGEERGSMPPLLKAYVRMGAKIAGEPCWDPDFNCADVFILLEVSKISRRYRDHFMAKAG
jgi:putative hemolysin